MRFVMKAFALAVVANSAHAAQSTRLSARIHDGTAISTSIEIKFERKVCYWERAEKKPRRLAESTCTGLLKLVATAKAEPTEPMMPHSQYFEISFKDAKVNWAKNTPFGLIKACDRKNECISNEKLIASQASLQALAQALLKVAEQK